MSEAPPTLKMSMPPFGCWVSFSVPLHSLNSAMASCHFITWKSRCRMNRTRRMTYSNGKTRTFKRSTIQLSRNNAKKERVYLEFIVCWFEHFYYSNVTKTTTTSLRNEKQALYSSRYHVSMVAVNMKLNTDINKHVRKT